MKASTKFVIALVLGVVLWVAGGSYWQVVAGASSGSFCEVAVMQEDGTVAYLPCDGSLGDVPSFCVDEAAVAEGCTDLPGGLIEGTVIGVPTTVPPVVTPPPESVELVGDVCAEDDPCWDCSTMGNRICGPMGDVELATVAVQEPELAFTGSSTVWLVGLGLGLIFVGLVARRIVAW